MYKLIIKDLKSLANKKQATDNSIFHKYEFNSYGISTPALRKLMRNYKNQILDLSTSQIFELLKSLYSSKIEEQLLFANYIMKLRNDVINPESFKFLDEILENFMSWSTVDDFCSNVLQPILMKYPDKTITLLKNFNKSKNMWKRRTSVVAFTRKIGESGKFTDIALELCDNLKNDKEDLIQKAVGWCLKDIMRGSKNQVIKYVKDLRANGAPAVITLYAIRDIKGDLRHQILKIKS